MTNLNFTKMEGAGNDFIVIDNRNVGISLDTIIEITPKLCHRRYGVGADGVLILTTAQVSGADYGMIYRNADGSDAGMCGNGGRCLALFASRNGFPASHSFHVHQNMYKAEIIDHEVRIFFPVEVKPEEFFIADRKLIKANAATEHVISFVEKAQLQNEAELIEEGRAIRSHPKLNPPGTNVNFVCYDNESQISVQTYERGVEGLTLACGTGALASAIASHFYAKSQNDHADLEVNVKGGVLKASFDYSSKSKSYYNLILTGPAHFVFEGSITV